MQVINHKIIHTHKHHESQSLNNTGHSLVIDTSMINESTSTTTTDKDTSEEERNAKNNFCDFTPHYMTSLENHIEKHNAGGQDSIRCSMCNYTCSMICTMEHHKMYHHKIPNIPVPLKDHKSQKEIVSIKNSNSKLGK